MDQTGFTIIAVIIILIAVLVVILLFTKGFIGEGTPLYNVPWDIVDKIKAAK